MDRQELQRNFPILTEIELLEELSEMGIERVFEAGEKIIRKGQYMKYIPLIISGSIKVMRENDSGNEVLLYFLDSGNTCAMSITCCMDSGKSKIWAIAEVESKVLLIPLEQMDMLMKKYGSWRNFVMQSYIIRMDDLLNTLDTVAFSSLDERLVKFLNDKSKALKKDTFSMTHGEIGKELNSSREAISRLLKKLESMGKVKLGRNQITLLDIS